MKPYVRLSDDSSFPNISSTEFRDMLWRCRCGTPTKHDINHLIRCADALDFLINHPAMTQKEVVKKISKIRNEIDKKIIEFARFLRRQAELGNMVCFVFNEPTIYMPEKEEEKSIWVDIGEEVFLFGSLDNENYVVEIPKASKLFLIKIIII